MRLFVFSIPILIFSGLLLDCIFDAAGQPDGIVVGRYGAVATGTIVEIYE